jgi:hypothetical protein
MPRSVGIIGMLLIAVLLGGCIDSTSPTGSGSAAGGEARCPFKRDSILGWELPERMTGEQTGACQAHFAARAPDGRFEPGSSSFTSQFCQAFVARDYTTRNAECQEVRVAVCREAVRDSAFTDLRSCLSAGIASRVVVHVRSPRVTVLIRDPAVFEEEWIDVTDNTLDKWFPDGGRIYLHEPHRKAWDSRLKRTVPFPRDLVEFLGRSPYLRVVQRRTVHLGNVSAKALDFKVIRGDPIARKTGHCGAYVSDMECLPITVDVDADGYTSFMFTGALFREPLRLVDLHTSNGRLILLVAHASSFQRLAAAERILATLRVG